MIKSILAKLKSKLKKSRSDNKHMFKIGDGNGKLPSYTDPLDSVKWLNVEESKLEDGDAVFGIMVAGKTWALSWRQLSHHHIAHLQLGELPVFISWCSMCSSGSAFKRSFSGQELHFVPDALYNGTYAIKDDIFGYLWHPFSGKAVSKEADSATLERLDLIQCTWDDWKKLNPDTLVAYDPYTEVFGKSSKPGGLEKLGLRFAKSIVHVDDRLEQLEMVLGLTLGSQSYAFKQSDLSQHTVYECTLDGQQVVVFTSKDSWLIRACFNQVRGCNVHFYSDDAGNVFDKETGSQWDYMGRAIHGEYKGEVLEPCTIGIQAWYAWATEHPETKVCEID